MPDDNVPAPELVGKLTEARANIIADFIERMAMLNVENIRLYLLHTEPTHEAVEMLQHAIQWLSIAADTLRETF